MLKEATVPTLALPPESPFTVQVTPDSTGPLTLAVKDWVCPASKMTTCGDKRMLIGLTIRTCASADSAGFATEVAAIMKMAGVGTRAGAVYKPEAVIVPKAWFPPATPFTLHVTAVFDPPVTVAVNCAVREVVTVVSEGLTLTVIVGGATVVEFVELAAAGEAPPHDVIEPTKTTASRKAMPIPNFLTFITKPQKCRDVGAATLVGRP